MAAQQPRLLDCGHVAPFAAVCQYQGCAKRLCPDCYMICETCGTILCRSHQIRLDWGRVFCPDDSTKHVAKKFLVKLLRLVVKLLRGGR
jgi:hypothetical protein